jgi:hypothetical protein
MPTLCGTGRGPRQGHADSAPHAHDPTASVRIVGVDDWRLTVALREEAHAGRLRRGLHEYRVEEDAGARLGSRVAVGGADGKVFLYTGTRDAAREAERVVREILSAHALEADFTIDRWHPLEERWENERVPLPRTEADRQSERERLGQDEVAESEELGIALWELRVELPTHREAVELARRLETESETLLPGRHCSVERRWKYLLIGAGSEDEAGRIADRLQGALPAGATLHVEPSGALAWSAQPMNPFAVFGGLAG